jgi:ASC-1-like (ASCH) protein
MRTLHIPLKREYFDAIKLGIKKEEYRLMSPHWSKRLLSRDYDTIELTWGYPKKDDMSRRIFRPYRGFTIRKIEHPHFGTEPVTVFALPVNE